jgi:hypothetical protein
MPARLFVIDSGGTAREIAWFPVVDAGGVTREIARLFVIDSGGVARLVLETAVFYVDWQNVTDQTVGIAYSSAEIQYQSDGDIAAITTAFGLEARGWWVEPTSLAPGPYTIRASVIAGSAPSAGDALDTDLPLTSTRTWAYISTGSPAVVQGTLQITIKDALGNVLATDDVGLQAEAL